VQVESGLPFQPDTDFITIGDADPHTQDPSAMRTAIGSGGREEQFTLVVLISAVRAGDADHTESVARAYALAAELEAELNDDATINGSLGTGQAYVAGLPLRKLGPDKDGRREARIRARLECHAVD
jgi:hypothetical protein